MLLKVFEKGLQKKRKQENRSHKKKNLKRGFGKKTKMQFKNKKP